MALQFHSPNRSWTCNSCTFSNVYKSTKCSMCHQPKPYHQQTEYVHCKQCQKPIPLSEYESHLLMHQLSAPDNNPPPSATIPCDQCKQQIPINKYEEHIASHNFVTCTHPSCNQVMKKSELASHLLVHQLSASSPKAKTSWKCTKCASDNLMSYKFCPKCGNIKPPEMIPCDYKGCNLKIPVDEYKAHMNKHKENENRILCTKCNQKILANEYDSHMLVHKLSDPVPNANSDLIPCEFAMCNLQIPRDKYKDHQRMHRLEEEKKMNDIMIECDFGGCGQMVPVGQYLAHQTEHNNAKIVAEKANLEQQLAELQEKLKQTEALKNKLKNVESEKNKNKQKIQALKQQIADEQKEKNELKNKQQSVQYPEYWDKNELKNLKYGQVKLFALDFNTNAVAKKVVENFKKTAANQIVKIEYVMNQMLFDKFWNERQSLSKLIGNDKLNEKNLFHGTKVDDVMKIVMKEGFRKEFNTASASGQGTYFARDANYSVGYSSMVNGVKRMFQCRVVCGESAQGSGNIKLTTWPKKASGLIYDTLVNQMANPSVYVVHENCRIYPCFVISFK